MPTKELEYLGECNIFQWTSKKIYVKLYLFGNLQMGSKFEYMYKCSLIEALFKARQIV